MKRLLRNSFIFLFVSFLMFPTSSFALNIGDKAPEFTAQSNQGALSLTDFEGKKNVVLALYFAVFTSV
jgi:hypothetical protein